MAHIVLVGRGGIGSRHLQGLSQIDRKADISVVDPNPESLALGKKRFGDMPANGLLESIGYYKSIDSISGDFDLAIIATNSDIRSSVVDELLEKVNINYFILEKVAFQSVECFDHVLSLFRKHDIKAWVNCPNRTYHSYKSFKSINYPNGKVNMHVDGGDWGLASSCIHYIDLFSYLTMETLIEFDTLGVDPKLYSTKRDGFIEFGGALYARTIKGDTLTIVDDKNSERPVVLNIANEKSKCIVFESIGKALIQTQEKSWDWEEVPFPIPHQSELTNILVQQILDNGTCDLISLEESYLLHKPMLDAFNEHLTNVMGQKQIKCPIT